MPLTSTDRTLIELWSSAWRHTGIRDQRVLEATGLHATQAAQRLNALLDMPAAEQELPVEVHRLQRIRARFSRSRRVEA